MLEVNLPKGGVRLIWGQRSEFLSNGQYQANARTLARAEGIRNLRASHPRFDIPDLRMFLMGWDAENDLLIFVTSRQNKLKAKKRSHAINSPSPRCGN